MTGGYAGAMGQPQFMPSSYLQLCRRFRRRRAARHLGQQAGRVRLDRQLPGAQRLARAASPGASRSGCRRASTRRSAGRDNRRPLGEWMRLGVRRDRRPAVQPRPTCWARCCCRTGRRRRGLHGVRQFQRDPALQPVRLLRAGGRPAGRRRRRDARAAGAGAGRWLLAGCTAQPAAAPASGAALRRRRRPTRRAAPGIYPREDFRYDATGLAERLPDRDRR